ncbi:ATP synthase F1 subunit gamma [Clostridium sp. 19966]|uniref:ATP synthase F1 subunit gamma n=1 Tax=Clostridium sp. 19966 TaxID=2768166 RepID=UPI0028E01D86|nr:ATP synthase F1 subunit gamma [Clostridium sp. 19966]MDT8715585.1 ATP synthase F1 subunit gamma [Clostridium sp. 19966]
MAGAGLIAIKRRMKSVKNTIKITKAMNLVATSKLRKVRLSLARAEEFNSEYAKLFEDVKDNFEGNSIFVRGNKSKKKLYVVFTSESGLCGGYNVSVVNSVAEFIGDDKENSEIFVVGQKGRSYFRRFKYETAAEYVEVSDIPTIKEAVDISRHIISLYEEGKVGEVYFVYTHFHSSVKQDVKIDKMLPIEIDKTKMNNNYITFEPDIEASFDYLLREYVKQSVYYTLTTAKASEHASRMNAMDGATKNANELIDDLNLLYNRIRQSSITQEITEIVAGSEVQR